MAEPYIGQIVIWAGATWAPDGWMFCQGQTLQISAYQALFSVIGTQYGGDGRATFQLPDLRTRVPLGSQNASVGQVSGSATGTANAIGAGSVTIGVNNLPAHSHAATFAGTGATPAVVQAATGSGGGPTVSAGSFVGSAPATGPTSANIFYPSTTAPSALVNLGGVSGGGITGGTVSVANTGGGQPAPVSVNVPVTVPVMQPSLQLNFIIAVTGIYPPRPQ